MAGLIAVKTVGCVRVFPGRIPPTRYIALCYSGGAGRYGCARRRTCGASIGAGQRFIHSRPTRATCPRR